MQPWSMALVVAQVEQGRSPPGAHEKWYRVTVLDMVNNGGQ